MRGSSRRRNIFFLWAERKARFDGWRRRPMGFTLLEMIIVAGMFVVIMTTVVSVFVAYSRSQRIGTQRQKIVAEVSLTLDQIARDLRVNELAYAGTFNYTGSGPETLYRVDVNGDETGNPYPATNIYQREREVVLMHYGANTTSDPNTITAYVLNQRDDGSVVNLCTEYTGVVGLYRFSKSGAADVTCQKMFDMPGIEVVDAGFFFTQPFNPSPDAVDALTDSDANRDADCGPNVGATFNGTFCECTTGNQVAACYSGICNPFSASGTAGRCNMGPNRQAAVTVYLVVRDTANPATTLTFQTTAAQRVYKR